MKPYTVTITKDGPTQTTLQLTADDERGMLKALAFFSYQVISFGFDRTATMLAQMPGITSEVTPKRDRNA